MEKERANVVVHFAHILYTIFPHVCYILWIDTELPLLFCHQLIKDNKIPFFFASLHSQLYSLSSCVIYKLCDLALYPFDT